jgi:acyl-CoA thioesterase-1
MGVAAGQAYAARIDIVALGASNTMGVNVGPNETYPAQLQAMLRQKGYDVRVKNAGVGGDTTADVLRRVNSAVPRGTEIVVLAPATGNDVIQARRARAAPDLKAMTANIEATIARLQARNIRVAYLSLGRGGAEIAQKYGVPFCQFPRQPELTSEGVHYTAEGNRQLAARVLPCVERLLKG